MPGVYKIPMVRMTERTLTDSAVYKLSRITDDAFEKLDLIPEF